MIRIVRGMVRPLSAEAVDPFALKAVAKWSPMRIAWTLESRALDRYARARKRSIAQSLDMERLHASHAERGRPLEDTAVTSNQLQLLMEALGAVGSIPGDLVEVGAYRGVTTAALAAATPKTVWAVDPYSGYGGSGEDLAAFTKRTEPFQNIHLIREPSGAASSAFTAGSLSFAFIDAVHDVANCWFDVTTWSTKLAPGGVLACHDVDDYASVGWIAQRAMRAPLNLRPWGYCPNLLVFRKEPLP